MTIAFPVERAWIGALRLSFREAETEHRCYDGYLDSILISRVFSIALRLVHPGTFPHLCCRVLFAKLHRQSPKTRTWRTPQPLTSSSRLTVCAPAIPSARFKSRLGDRPMIYRAVQEPHRDGGIDRSGGEREAFVALHSTIQLCMNLQILYQTSE